MKRRQFITLLGGAAAWPLAARAQQPGKRPMIGFLGTTSQAAWRSWTREFVQRLRELGWVEGNTVAIEYRWTEERGERLVEIAHEFVRLKVDVIVAGGAAVPTLKQATSIIPIVFPIAPDPVGTGMITSLARPSGNVTGLSAQTPDLAGKRLELLREVIPTIRRFGVLANARFPAAALEMREVATAALTLGLEVSAH
jgi:putative ABC transport system substrate-binding protein